MNANHPYQRAMANSWTRIDMLLALYEAALQSLESGVATINAERTAGTKAAESKLFTHRSQVQRIVLQLLDGLDLKYGDLPSKVQSLCLFVLTQVRSDEAADWESARHVIQLLHEGFAEVQEESRRLEFEGQLPGLVTESYSACRA